jgi:heptosyltransferase II
MALPAIRAHRDQAGAAGLVALAKRRIAPLWEMVEGVDEVVPYDDGAVGVSKAAAVLRAGGFETAVILPNSFRSALLPFLGGIPQRRGRPGHARRALLTDIVADDPRLADAHQALEYVHLLVPEALGAPLQQPRLRIPDSQNAWAQRQLRGLARPVVGVMPGAARGPSKRWPAKRFAEVARKLAADRGCGIAVFGAASERDLCARVAGAVPGAVDLSGSTTLPQWAALLASCDLAICNDSGGMHLAAAAGTPLVAVFGATDPAKTGPLSDACRIVQSSDVRSRKVARSSEAAARSLAAVRAEQVYQAALELLGDGGGQRR